MAPHALTPTSEQGDFLGGDYPINDNSARRSISIPLSSDITNDYNGATANPTSSLNGNPANISGNGEATEHRTTTTPDSSEEAYSHGYKEGYTSGYTRSHIELKHQPIAIIGMSCRLPGNVSTPDEFWELLARSRSGFSGIPSSRFSSNRFFHPNPGKSGTTNARGGNFLTHDLKTFDAPFFGFTQQEAISLDPQQRLLLECTFEALESAGIPKQEVVGKDVGVFVGGTFSEYEADLFRDSETIPMHQATGCAMAMQSNRISHFFDLRGPSFTVDTACSSSLVALHTACQSLRTGESSLAIAAGVHLNMLPEFWVSYSMSRLFGESGRSFAFDERGTGYGRGEGCGMILLKPLEQAIKDNDPIRAVITGSGVNQDGKTPGITMPNGSAQETLIRSVYKNGGMDPRDTGYVEAHGTGTRVGDPIEVGALHNVFGDGRSKRKPLYIGSVKSNIGHLEAAAGIAGVIKTALMLERGFILPNYDFQKPNDKIPFEEWSIKVATRQQPWPLGKRWASVNGFGFGGTNAHVVMTKGPLERKTMKEDIVTQASERLFVLSANDKAGVEQVMNQLGVYLEQRPEVFQNDLLANLAYTLGQRKSLHQWRVALTASSAAEIVESLSSGKIVPVKQNLHQPRFGWIFTGQGAQWWAMGRELYQRYPIYATALNRADNHLRTIGAEFSLLQELQKNEKDSQVDAANISQPSCTAIQLALVDLLRSWRVSCSAVAGHSSGEIGAAYAADIITFEDAMTIAYHRGRLIPVLKTRFPNLRGSMMAVGAGTAEISPLLKRLQQGGAKIACINSPTSVTVSGDTDAITELQGLIEEIHPGMFSRKLQVDTAYHSHHMDLVAADYTKSLRGLETPKPSTIRFHSSLRGRLAATTELDANYWVQNLLRAVRFDEAVQSMCQPVCNEFQTGVDFLIEVGPHAALQGPIKQTLKHIGLASKIAYASVLSRKRDAVQTSLELAGTLFVKGVALNLEGVNFPEPLEKLPQVLIDMPRYPWNHTSTFYHESRLTKVQKYHETPRNDIIGVLAPYSNDFEPVWRNIIRLDDLPWLRQHQMQGVTMFPISGFVAMALEAIAQKAQWHDFHYDSFEVKNLKVTAPAVLTEEELEMTITLIQCSRVNENKLAQNFNVRSWSKDAGWTEHCTGMVAAISTDSNEVDSARVQQIQEKHMNLRISRIKDAAIDAVSTPDLYERLGAIGVSYGAAFQGLQSCRASANASTAQLTKIDTAAEMPHHEQTDYILPPNLLEQLISMFWPVLSNAGPLRTVYLPSSIGKITVSANMRDHMKSHESLQAFCEPAASLSNTKSNTLSMFALDHGSRAVVSIEDLLISPIIETGIDAEISGVRELCYKVQWEPVPALTELDIIGAKKPVSDAEVVIIHGESDTQCAFASMVSDHLTRLTGRSTVMSTFTGASEISKDKFCIVLVELEKSLLATLNASDFEFLQHLLTNVQGCLWVVHGAYIKADNPHANMVSGLSRTLRSEGTLMKFITLDLETSRINSDSNFVVTICDLFIRTLAMDNKSEETEFVVRDEQLYTPRIIHDDDLNHYVHDQTHPSATEPTTFSNLRRPLRGSVTTLGASDGLKFDDDKNTHAPLPDDHVEFQVKAIGVSARDAMVSSDIGTECSGIIIAIGSTVTNFKIGDRITAITPNGGLSTVTRTPSAFVIKLPDFVSFELGATLPIAYCTAIYALIEQAKLVEGETVLVHDGASAVGQAALAIAKMIDAKICVSVRNAEEKDLLMREFGIPQNMIWYIGGEAFAECVRTSIDGDGAHVVFNTVQEAHVLQQTWGCIANFGRFINVGAELGVLDTTHVEKNVTILPANFAALSMHRPRLLQRILADMSGLLRYGKIRPIQNVKTFGISDATAALQSAKALGVHGRIVILPQDDELVMAPRIASQQSLLRADATYILIGGTGGLGRSMAKWMVGKGAKNIVLLSRTGALRGKAKDQIDALNHAGSNVIARRCDVTNRTEVEDLITGLGDLPPVRGIIHGAMVLHDVLFEKMTHEQYTSVVASKVEGAWNFHHALSTTPLDFFIVISSAAGAVGNRGQAAYAAANTFLNGFAQHLQSKGLNSASIDLTAVSDAGYLAEDKEKAAEVARNFGTNTICEAEVLALIQAAIEGKLTSCNGHPITGMGLTPTRPFWSNDAKFKHLLAAAEAASASSTTTVVSWSAAFKAASSRAEAETIACNALVDKIAEVISMEPEELDMNRALSHYPLDSLTAIEVRNFITRTFEASLQVLELLASGSIKRLAEIVCTKSKVVIVEE